MNINEASKALKESEPKFMILGPREVAAGQFALGISSATSMEEVYTSLRNYVSFRLFSLLDTGRHETEIRKEAEKFFDIEVEKRERAELERLRKKYPESIILRPN